MCQYKTDWIRIGFGQHQWWTAFAYLWTFINWIINRFPIFFFHIEMLGWNTMPNCIRSILLEASAVVGNYGKLLPSICKLVFIVYILPMWFHCFNSFWIPMQPQLLYVLQMEWNGKAIRYFRTMVEAIELSNAIHSMYASDECLNSRMLPARHKDTNSTKCTRNGIFDFRKPNRFDKRQFGSLYRSINCKFISVPCTNEWLCPFPDYMHNTNRS